MGASAAASVHSPFTRCSLASSSSQQAFPSSVLFFAKRRSLFQFRREHWFLPLSFVVGGGGRERRCALFGFFRVSGLARDSERGLHCGWSGFVRRCRDDGDADFALEAGILEFMKSSEKPQAFPTRKELVDSGRMDLAEAIVKQGGWLTMGWDLEEEEAGGGGGGGQEDQDLDLGSVTAVGYNDLQKNSDCTGKEEEKGAVSSCPYDYSSSASSDSTVGGFLGSCRSSSLPSKKAIFVESGHRFNRNKSFSDVDGLRSSHEPETWRAWSIQRAGFSDFDPEVIEISSGNTIKDESVDVREDEKLRRASDSDHLERKESGYELIDLNQLCSRLQHLELELSSVLQAVRSNADVNASEKDHENSSDDLQKLSDAWEFQENEIMNAHDKLRSIRAKLAVLEGKAALIMEEKQKRIDDAHKALQLLRPACIIWPNSASEVLLAGSFDGWATQRKMEKSSAGVFLCGCNYIRADMRPNSLLTANGKSNPCDQLL